MRLSRPILHSLALTFVLILPAARSASAADSFADAGRQLAAQITARLGPGSEVNLTVRNASSVSASQFAELRRALEVQLRAAGLRLVPSAPAEVRVTLSENTQAYLWVADIRQGQNQQVAIVAIARVPAATAPATAPTLVLRKTPLWVQDQPILDLAVLDNGARLLVLEPARVALYAMQNARGELQQSQAIPRTGVWPRDLRGRLVLRPDHLFDAYLPGTRCSTPGQDLAAINCVDADDPWPLDASLSAFFTPARNFFTGILTGSGARGNSTAPFFSAAKVEEKGADLWIFAGLDGRVRFFNGASETTADFKNWGSDIASVKSGCGGGTQMLVTRAGDADAPDAVQAFEIAGRQAAAASQPVEFGGPITALWPAAAGASALAVVRNLKTGKYEAFSLTMACER